MVKKTVTTQRQPHTARDDSRKSDSIFSAVINNEYPPYNPGDFALAVGEDESELTQNHNVHKPTSNMSNKQDLLKKIREELQLWTAESSTEYKKSCPEHWTSVRPQSMYLIIPLAQSVFLSKMHFWPNVFYFFQHI